MSNIMADTVPVKAFTVPSRTTPTWEVELLISGALVISLFQLVHPLELTFAKWMAMVPADREPIVVYGFVYSKLVLFSLIGTFVLHVAARAGWVALVGVHTIFPQGPRWENLSGGPATRRVVRHMCGSIEDAIERADNRATLVFGYGILAAQFAFVILVLMLGVVLLSIPIERLVGLRWALFGAAALLFAPFTLLALIDRLAGARLREGDWLARMLERGLRLTILLNLGRLTQPLLPLVTTNIGGRRGNLLLGLVFMLMIAAVMVDTLGRADGMSLMRGRAFPEQARSSGVNPLHYASMRSEMQRFTAAPYIPAEVIEGPYLRLFLPYTPDRHDVALNRDCAAAMTGARQLQQASKALDDVAVLKADDARRANETGLLSCFAGLMDLRLDGAPIAGVVLERHRDPLSGHDGGLAMIDVRGLAPGRHELQIKRLPRASSSIRFQSSPSPAPDRIVFWR